MNLITGLVVAALLLCAPGITQAQTSRFRPAPSPLFRAAATPTLTADTLNLPETYWKEGALIGGVPMFLVGAWFGRSMCGMDESTDGSNCALAMVGGGIMGGLMGGIVGGLIGGSIAKEPK